MPIQSADPNAKRPGSLDGGYAAPAPANIDEAPVESERRSTGVERAAEDAHLPQVEIPAGGEGAANVVKAGIPGLARGDLENRARANQAGALDLLPGRYPDAVGLQTVLAAMQNDPRFGAMVKKLIADFETKTGVKIPPALANAAVANPSRLADLFAVTPEQLSKGMEKMVQLYQAGAIKDAKPKSAVLPQHFELKDLTRAPVEVPKYELKELAPGLFQGDVRSALPDDQAKANIALAEAFDRLADNPSRAAGERFRLKYDGREYTRLESLLHALEKNGHTIEVSFGHRIANFTDLKTKTPDGRVLDVPAALLIRTGVMQNGEEAVLPAAHAEMLISVKSNANTRGPKLDADVKFFQGMNATGFFPCDVAATPSWCGYVKADALAGKDALKAIDMAGLLSDVINKVAREKNLPFAGYGLAGVCMDSVQVVRNAMTGKLGYYPLLMRDSLLQPTIQARLLDHDRRDDPEYRAIAKSIAEVPSDAAPDAAAARARMLNSIPWPEGQEPFQSVIDARRILREVP